MICGTPTPPTRWLGTFSAACRGSGRTLLEFPAPRAAALLLALPVLGMGPTALAQTQIRSATLTPGSISSSIGYFNRATPIGAITDKDFAYDNNDYTTQAIRVSRGGGLQFSTFSALTQNGPDKLVLEIDGSAFRFSDSTASGTEPSIRNWNSAGWSWTVGLSARGESHAGGVTRLGSEGVTPSRSRNAVPHSPRRRPEAARNPLGDGRLQPSALSFAFSFARRRSPGSPSSSLRAERPQKPAAPSTGLPPRAADVSVRIIEEAPAGTTAPTIARAAVSSVPGADATYAIGGTIQDAAQPGAGDVIPEHELRAHHIGIQMGLLNPSTDVVELGNPGLDVEGNTFLVVLNYRYSLNSFIDLSGDLRSWGGPRTTPASQHVKLGVYCIGPGLRVYGLNRTTDRRVMPYVQGSIYYVQEELITFERLVDHGIGFGLSGGVDLNMSRLISIPIEATYVGTSGDDMDDLSGFGLSVGVNFSF